MKFLYVTAFLIISGALLTSAAPLFDEGLLDLDFDLDLPDFSDIRADCSSFGCPNGTTACSKKTTTSQDKQTITKEVKCFSSDGATTKDETQTENNPNPNSFQNSYEFYGSYSSGFNTDNTNTQVHTNYNINKNPNTEDTIEPLN